MQSPWQTCRRMATALRMAWNRFNGDDGWAIASHVTLSGILALFPFLIFCAAVAAFLELGDFPETAVHLVFDAWPQAVAGPLAAEIRNVLTVPRGDVLTFGALAALYFASGGVEAMRLGLNRAYGHPEKRHFLVRRLQSLAFVAMSALVVATVGLLIVAIPLAGALARRLLPEAVEQFEAFAYWRLVLSGAILVAALWASHKWLPAGRRETREILPGMILTVACWLFVAQAFAVYLGGFADYVGMYAGLAGIVVALVFVYLMSAIFLFGAEFNAALMRVESVNAEAQMPAKT